MAMTPGDAALAARLAAVRERIAAAALAAGRRPDDVTLLPVSKTHPAELVARVAKLSGLTVFAENRPQELAAKAPQLPGLGWALIGPLQTNKAGLAARWAGQFQALDSLHVAQALDRRLQQLGRGMDVMLEVNTSGEASKHGVTPGDAPALARALEPFASLRPIGLMTVAVNSDDEARVRACFRELVDVQRRLRDQGGDWPELSMGMSGDYGWAIEEGATMVRIGRAIFGAR